jgi:chromate transporter
MIELILSFLKLGFTAFGGPAAAYAMMRQEFVSKRKWLSEEQFFEYLGISNLIPGPNATELALMIGYLHLGVWGLILAGISYIVPAMLVVLILAWIYVEFGTLPELTGILYGIKPVIVAILISAIWRMLRPRLKKVRGLAVVAVVFGLYLLGVSPVYLLLGGGIFMISFDVIRLFITKSDHRFVFIPLWFFTGSHSIQPQPYNILRLFLVFLKAGALMYGSGYVLLAFIHEDLVNRLGWLTNTQLVDAIAIGQVTPGPLATTATFVGYLMGGVPAAGLATLAMFIPSFCITIILLLVLKKISLPNWVTTTFEGVSFAALGLMLGVTWDLAGAAIVDPFTGLLALAALILLFWKDLGAPWLILGGGLLGWLETVLF